MPQNTPYPGETPQQFQMRMLQGGGGAPTPGAPGYMPGQQQPGMNVPNSPMMPPAPGGAPQAGAQNPYGLDPAMLEAMLGTYGDQLELGAMDEQMAQAEALRMATPEGRQAGRTYVAANPLEHLGKGIGDYKLMKKRQEYEKGSGDIRRRIGENVKTYGKNYPGE